MTTLPKDRTAARGRTPVAPAPCWAPPPPVPAAARKPGPVGAQRTPTSPAGPGTPSIHGAPLSVGGTWMGEAAGEPLGEVRSPAARSWTIELPAGLKVLSLNQRLHWAEKGRRARELRKAAWAMAISRRVPHLDRISVIVEYQPPDKRHRDADNIPAASGKHCIDGLVDAKIIPDDESPRYVADIRYRLGEQHPKGRLVLHVTEEVPQ